MSRTIDNKYAAGLQAIEEALCQRAVIGMRIGTKAELADELGISRQALNQWRRVPHERVLEVERILGISRSVLRPDIYPPTEGRTHGGRQRAAAR